MGEQQMFIFFVVVMIITYIVIPKIETATVDDTNAMSKLNLDNLPRSRVDVCCPKSFIGFLNWEMNATGHTVSKSGISFEILDWLSFSMKFDYECLPQKDSERFTRDTETNTTEWTSLYQLKHGMCHIALVPFIVTYTRFKNYCDFLSSFTYAQYNLLIPVPQFAVGGSVSSVWKPFEISVWIALLVSIAVTMVLSIINWLYNLLRVAKSERYKVSLEPHSLFIFGLLVSKAGFRAPNSLKMRLAGGAWCIGALILTNFYSSVLTSTITTSIPVPIANSVEEVANNEGIELVIQKGYGLSAMITDGKGNNPLLRKLDKKLESSRNSLCSNPNACFRRVIEKKSTDKQTLFALVSEDYHQTGRCNAAFAKETFLNVPLSWAISKNYSEYENYQLGLLRIIETGLAERWVEMYLPTPFQCMVDPSSRQTKLAEIRNPALVNLRGLVPAFLFLLFGFFLAFIALLAEWIKSLGIGNSTISLLSHLFSSSKF